MAYKKEKKYMEVSNVHRNQLDGAPNDNSSDDLSIKIDDDSKEL